MEVKLQEPVTFAGEDELAVLLTSPTIRAMICAIDMLFMTSMLYFSNLLD